MRTPSNMMVIACCLLLATTRAYPLEPSAQCQDKPNLTNVAAVMSNLFFMEGGDMATVADDVLMIDFTVTVDNAGGVEAPGSRMNHTAKLMSSGGNVIETFAGVTNLYWTDAGETDEALVTIMASKLASLVQPSGELTGSVAFHAIVDVDNQVDECDETDNEVDVKIDLNYVPESPQS